MRNRETTQTATPRVACRRALCSGQPTNFVFTDEPDWTEASNNHAVQDVAVQNHLLSTSMARLASDLPRNFLRMSRFAILRSVKQLQSNRGQHHAVMNNEARAPVTMCLREVQQRLLGV